MPISPGQSRLSLTLKFLVNELSKVLSVWTLFISVDINRGRGREVTTYLSLKCTLIDVLILIEFMGTKYQKILTMVYELKKL